MTKEINPTPWVKVVRDKDGKPLYEEIASSDGKITIIREAIYTE